MLRQVFIVKDDNFLYERNYGKAISNEDYYNMFVTVKGVVLGQMEKDVGSFEYEGYLITCSYVEANNIYFIFVTSTFDDSERNEEEITKLKEEFFNLFSDLLDQSIESALLEVLNPVVDGIQKNLRAKVSLVGFPGVGKTTITKLIKEEQIPSVHIPTITGDRATIKIGNLVINILDFAGQEQFSYLWKTFIKGSDAVFIITNSTHLNVDKSRFFLDLIRDEAPYAFAAVIGNKQDLPIALSIDKIEEYLELKTYSMVAIDPKNRTRMIQIISDVLEIAPEVSPLLQPLDERDRLMIEAQLALESGEYEKTIPIFERLADICYKMGDDNLGSEFYSKIEQIKNALSE